MAFQIKVKANATNVTVPIMVVDSTDGTPETGYAFNTAGIDLWYRRGPTGAEVSITEATQTVTGAHSDGGVVHISDGRGRLDLPDAAVAAGVDFVEYGGTITGMVVIGGFIELVVGGEITGTFSGTHTSTTADLGANAPANDITGMTLFVPTDNESRIITSYVTGTGVATFDAWDTGVGVTDGEPWRLFPTAPIDTGTKAAIADVVWDEVLTAAAHNVATSAGRRLRTLQTGGNYENGAVWVDTVNGTSGTTDDENGVVTLPVLTWAEAQTVATSVGLSHFHIANGSSITLDANTDNKEIEGDEFTIALGGQSIDNTSISHGLSVSGTFTGYPHILHTGIGPAGITGPGAKIGYAALRGPVVSNAATNRWVLHDCWGVSETTSEFDFGVAVAAAQTALITSYHGPLIVSNMNTASDALYLSGNGTLTISASCTTGTIYISGQWAITNNGASTIVYDGLTTDAAAIKVVTDTLADFGTAILSGTAQTGTLSTTVATTNLTGYADDELIGRTVVFISGTAAGQSARITDYANTNGQLTYTTLTTAPVNNDTFVII